MTDTRKSGFALIAGSFGTLITMAIHPHGTGDLSAPEYAHLAAVSGIAHTLALVSMVIFFLGALGLSRTLLQRETLSHPSDPDRLALAALVSYAVAIFSIVIAAAVSGFIVPRLFLMRVHDDSSFTPHWHIVVAAIFQFNQAFSRIYTVAGSAAILLWSVSALRNGGLGRGIAVYGCVAGALLILAVFAGNLQLDVHGATAVVLFQAIWFIAVGTQLLKQPAVLSPAI